MAQTSFRKFGTAWNLTAELYPDGSIKGATTENIIAASNLMIVEELRKLNSLLACPNFVGIPKKLEAIRRAIAAKRPKQRICSKCIGPITRGDKWLRGSRGYQHRNCKSPRSYP